MVVVDLKLTLFLFLLLLLGLVWLVGRVASRRPLLDDTQASVWQSFPLGVVLLSVSNRFQFANRRAQNLLQVEQDEITTAVDTHLLPKLEEDTAVQHFPLTLASEATIDVWVGKLGRSRLLLLRDLSAQRQREIDLQLYWGGVSHELRTPLTSILSHAEVARSENVPPEIQSHSLEIIYQQTQRLINLIHNMLELGRLKSAAVVNKVQVDIVLVAEEAIAELILLAETQEIDLNFQCAAPTPYVLGDPDKLKQLFVNLLDNALKYCQAGDVITVSLATIGDDMQCRVADTGPGIPPEYLSHVTQQFYRVRRDMPGSGLGLAIAEEIVRQHNGRLHITSHTEGAERGTAVAFTLPILPDPTIQ